MVDCCLWSGGTHKLPAARCVSPCGTAHFVHILRAARLEECSLQMRNEMNVTCRQVHHVELKRKGGDDETLEKLRETTSERAYSTGRYFGNIVEELFRLQREVLLALKNQARTISLGAWESLFKMEGLRATVLTSKRLVPREILSGIGAGGMGDVPTCRMSVLHVRVD
jgi:hypothetical protein